MCRVQAGWTLQASYRQDYIITPMGKLTHIYTRLSHK